VENAGCARSRITSLYLTGAQRPLPVSIRNGRFSTTGGTFALFRVPARTRTVRLDIRTFPERRYGPSVARATFVCSQASPVTDLRERAVDSRT
jgi:hypothetical protein